jgi:hypothetical protein
MDQRGHQAFAAALAIVTDWMHDADGTMPFDQKELSRVILDDDITDAELVTALITLATILLVKLEKYAGTTSDSVLADIGMRCRDKGDESGR